MIACTDNENCHYHSSTWTDILSSEHEEAIFVATEALKGLISSCIDERLVAQGVEQIKLNAEKGIRNSGPTIIEKICSTMESLLGYQYNSVWDMSFQVLSAAFYQLGNFRIGPIDFHTICFPYIWCGCYFYFSTILHS